MSNQWTNLQPLITGGVAGVLILLAVIVSAPTLRRWWADRRIRRLIARLGPARIENAMLADGLGGFVYIEHLLLTAQGALLIGVKPYGGTIFAAANIDHWTQVLGRRSFRFANPLEQLQSDAQAIRGQFPQLPLDVRIVFSKDSVFPKGKPDAVLSFEQLRQSAKSAQAVTIPPRLEKQWQQLLRHIQPAGKQEKRLLNEGLSFKPVFAGLALIVVSLVWIMWRIHWPAGLWD